MFRSKFMLKLDKFVKLYRDLNLYCDSIHPQVDFKLVSEDNLGFEVLGTMFQST